MNSGKRFESWWAASASRCSDTIVYRIPDKVFVAGGRINSKESEADYFWFGRGWAMIVECKAHNGKSIPFSCLKPHQEESLLRFSEYVDAVVAVNLYGDNVREFNTCWHIPIGVWVELRDTLGRASIPLQVLQDDQRIRGFERIKGGVWDLTPCINAEHGGGRAAV